MNKYKTQLQQSLLFQPQLVPYKNTFCLNYITGASLPEREPHREHTSFHLLRWFMGRDPKRKQSSGEVSLILFDIKIWNDPKNVIKNHKHETFMKIRPVRVAMTDRDERQTCRSYESLFAIILRRRLKKKIDSNVNNKDQHLYVSLLNPINPFLTSGT